MPTKHIDDASYTLAEETLVKAVVLTKKAVKDSDILSLLIHKGAETVTPVDILTRLGASPTAWAEIFNQVLEECSPHYPLEYISTFKEFREKADLYSATWREYDTVRIHQHICDAGQRLQKLSDFTFSQLEPDFELETEEEKQGHEQWLSGQIRKMNDALATLDGSALGALSDDDRSLMTMMMESEDFQVRFLPLPDKRRADGRHEFTVHAARFPNAAQAGLMALLDDLKSAGLKLTWHRYELNAWLQERPQHDADDLVIDLFALADEGRFTFKGNAELAEENVRKCLTAHDIGPISSGTVMATLEHAVAAGQS
ncbi:hypothetical protein [Pantoea agglomerans]|uniref:hypothetical protein n=1 Tax=Enterobacter agglomerans TaxID=549 RepID=UPI00045D2F7B|nr:hypothetical protein [Pantoea agglomerans]KDA94264.1 repressor [Pantoea agglomerans Eh318]